MVDAIDPQPGQTVLELAAGTGDTGFLAAELIEPGGTLICSDFAPEMLAAAQRRAAELGVRNVRFKQIDAESIDLEAASLDGVLCRWGYMLMADPETALQEARRVLKPNRRLALSAWAGPEDNPWTALGRRAFAERGLIEPPDPNAPGQFTLAPAGVIADLLEGAGFTDQHVEALDFEIEFASFDDWWDTQLDLSRLFGDAVARADPALVADARAATEAAAEPYRRADGSL